MDINDQNPTSGFGNNSQTITLEQPDNNENDQQQENNLNVVGKDEQENITKQEKNDSPQIEENKQQQNDNEQNNQEILEEIENEEVQEGDDGGDYDVSEIYKYLRDNNIAPDIENLEDVKTIEDIAQVIASNQQEQLNQLVQNELSNYPQAYQDLFNFVRNGGNVEDFTQSYRNAYSDIDVKSLKDNISLQDKTLFDYFKATTQWDDKMIQKHLNKYDDDEKSEFSKSALKTLKDIEVQQKQQLLQQQQQQVEQQEQYRQQIFTKLQNDIKELSSIGEMELTVRDKQEIQKMVFEDVTYNKLKDDFEKYRLNLVILDKLGLLDNPNLISDQKINKKTSTKYNLKKKNKNNKNSTDDNIFPNVELINTQKDKSEKPYFFL